MRRNAIPTLTATHLRTDTTASSPRLFSLTTTLRLCPGLGQQGTRRGASERMFEETIVGDSEPPSRDAKRATRPKPNPTLDDCDSNA